MHIYLAVFGDERVAEVEGKSVGERAYWLAWSQMPRVGPILMLRLRQQFGSLAVAWEAPAEALGRVQGFGPKTLEEVLGARSQFRPQLAYGQHLAANPLFWTPGEEDYPVLLRELPSPPPLLYYRGKVEPLENQGVKPAIALVGTRRPTDYGLRWTQRLSRALALRGFTVVSGLAEGVDTAAHRACLEAGGRTIAVVGTGVDRVYPARNRGLCEAILQQGLVVSEYPAGTRPDRAHFPQRNRIIAGLCRATIVVEAPRQSGALITAYGANEYCRDVYVVPGSLDNPKVRGGLELIGQGAQVILDEDHLLEMLGAMPLLDGAGERAAVVSATVNGAVPDGSGAGAGAGPVPTDLLPELGAVLGHVGPVACSLDGLVERCGQGVGEVSSALLQLELMGLVVELPGKLYQRC